MGAHLPLDGPDQRGFAGAHVAGDEQEPLVLQNAVFKDSETLAVFLPQPQKIGVRTERAALFIKN